MPALATAAPDVLKLMGHDVRWQLVRTLADSDYRVSELVDVVGLPQNLVSYHLRMLRDGALVAERRSSADARDVYYHLDVGRLCVALSTSAGAIHPSVVMPVAPTSATHRGPVARPRVLFICTGNSARSQMAEAILRSRLGSKVAVYSAGPVPTKVHPLTVEVLRRMGIDVGGLRSKGTEEFRGIDFNFVITLCDKAREVCAPDYPGARCLHWSLSDPTVIDGTLKQRRQAFQATAAEIASRVTHLIPVMTRQREA